MSMLLMVQAMKCRIGNSARKLVLMKLADNASDDGVCFPSYQHIADQCEMTRRSAINHIDALIEMGLVEKKLRKTQDGNTSNIYFLHLEKASENSAPVVKNLHYPSENISPTPSENISPRTSHSSEPVNEPRDTSEKISDGVARKKSESFSPDDEKTAHWIFSKIQRLNPEHREPNFARWANEVRLMRERDGRTHREICELFQWANADSFWCKNILSPAKLREQWDRLVIERNTAMQKSAQRNRNDVGGEITVEDMMEYDLTVSRQTAQRLGWVGSSE